HSEYSPDSAVAAADRVLSMAAEGMDFWVSLEHDVVVDYSDHIAEMGLRDVLLTAAGSEVTPFDIGHFGAYPLEVAIEKANGGAPDWGVRDDGTRPTMDELFQSIHDRGALVQVNHPRSSSIGFQAYFTRA